ncbi:MAG: mechanosensitive ion channel family protein [Dehalococcoidia bacterium]|nr:mechanosensitive ion channel family protein [Dehalococcoidia bacterium]
MRDFFTDIDWSRWSETVWTTGVRVIVILVALYIALRIIERVLHPAIRATISAHMEDQPQVEIDKRVDTLSHVAYRTLSIVAVFIALMTILPEFGINVSALLAGFGIIGIAVGFGAQSLVRDVIGGLFILIENQYGKGDVVNMAGVGGLVEDVNLRRTMLRDLDGAVHTIPHSQITVTSNLTRARSGINMLVRVSYGDDLDRVFEVINRTGEELARDPAWSGDILDPPKVLGIEEFADSGIQIRILGETQPIRQWDTMRELRLRLKKAFDAEGIEIPFPHRTLATAGRKAADGLVVRMAGDAPA